MKQRILFLWVLTLALLAACSPVEENEPSPPEEEDSLTLESLFVEVPRSSLSAQELARAVRELPEALKNALAAQGINVETVHVSVSSSPEAAAQAVAEGGVDVAFLSAEDFAALDSPPKLILAAGPLSTTQSIDDASGASQPGVSVLICAAPTDCGIELSGSGGVRGEGPTWDRLSEVRWGLLENDSLLGRQAVDLWLFDHYGSRTTADLKTVTVYDSYEALIRAAAAEEIDLLPLWDTPRQDWAEAWTMDSSKTDSRGVRGLGRPAPLEEELPVLAVTSRLYTGTAVVRPDGGALAEPPFSSALAAAVNSILPEQPVFGPHTYAPAADGDLAPQRRLAHLG